MATLVVQIATTENAFFKPQEVSLPLTHACLLDAAKKKFKNVTKKSRLFDGICGSEIRADMAGEVKLAPGAKVMVSGKAGWRGAERLRAERCPETPQAPASGDFCTGECESSDPDPYLQCRMNSLPTVRLQLVSFSYDRGQPRDTQVNLSARQLPGPGRAAMGRTGLEKRLAKEVLATRGAAEFCERVVREALIQIERHYRAAQAAADAAVASGVATSIGGGDDAGSPPLLRVGVGCDRGLHRSVAIAEAATKRLVRKAEHARACRNSPGMEWMLQHVHLMDVHHRELLANTRATPPPHVHP